MTQDGGVVIGELTSSQIEDVVRLHLAGMNYSLNAQLGKPHLAFLYEAMREDPTCYVGVATLNEKPVGVISGSADAGAFTSTLLKKMPARNLIGIALRFMQRPRLAWLWLQAARIAAPIRWESEEVRAVLTAIVVDESVQGRGVGRALVGALEAFLRRQEVGAYRLDTKLTNERSAEFYRRFGFQESARRADSIIFVRGLDK